MVKYLHGCVIRVHHLVEDVREMPMQILVAVMPITTSARLSARKLKLFETVLAVRLLRANAV